MEKLGGLDGPRVRPSDDQTTSVSLKTPATEYAVHDTMRYGFHSAKSDLAPAHPMERLQSEHAANREALVYQALRNTHGVHMPMRLQMERTMAAKIQRMPPLQSSMVALETLLGEDTSIGVEELLNPSSESPVIVNGRAMMEKKLKMI